MVDSSRFCFWLLAFVMEVLIILAMIVMGVAIAVVVAVVAGAVSTQERGAAPAPNRESIAASLIYHIGSLGGTNSDRVLAFMREELRLVAPLTRDIHASSWADAYRRASSEAQRTELLESAVRMAVALNTSLPLEQYNALLDLSFGLGFQTDALARLRARYRFEYTDYAKAARPRSADRSGGATPLFDRTLMDTEPLLSVLGLSGKVSRQELTTTYRRLAAQNHPDRFHNATPAEQESAAARFIALTEAYERLLVLSDE